MDAFTLCYVLDCSGSMVNMPKEAFSYIKKLFKEVKDNFDSLRKENKELRHTVVKVNVVTFGSYINVSSVEGDKIEKLARNKSDDWNCSMGQTSLYDSIVLACILSKSEKGGVVIIITDGEENNSLLDENYKTSVVHVMKKFRENNGKIILVGVGTEDYLSKKFEQQIDKIYPLDPSYVHRDIATHIASQSFVDGISQCVRSATLGQ
jgi:uncharacterized protein YegL